MKDMFGQEQTKHSGTELGRYCEMIVVETSRAPLALSNITLPFKICMEIT